MIRHPGLSDLEAKSLGRAGSAYSSTSPTPRPIAVDLFSGAGGLSLGFEAAGFDVAVAIDLDPVHCATHEFNFPYSATMCRDVGDLDARQIRAASGIGDTPIGVVIGGAPCQGFSLIGQRALDDPRNDLLTHFVRLVCDLQPLYFAFENVKGLTVGQQRQALDEMIAALSPHYRIVLPYRVLNAADFQVPQNRRRLFLLGARNDHPLPSYPSPQPDRVTVADALSDIPNCDLFQELRRSDSANTSFGPATPYAATMRGLVDDPNDFSHPRPAVRNLLTASLRTEHQPRTRRRFAQTTCGATEPTSRLYRLNPSTQANTIRAGTASDRGALTSPRPIHPEYPRVLTNREAARLHSFPDWFRVHVTKWHGFRQIGNSVPPLLARAIGAEIMRSLRITPARPQRELTLGDPSPFATKDGSSCPPLRRSFRRHPQASPSNSIC